MRKVWLALAVLLFASVAMAQAPVCLFQDILSGPVSGGENNNGTYLTITGQNLGTSGTITINGTAVAQTFNWGAADVTGRYQTVGMQVASGTTSGSIVLTNSGGSCSNLSFTVRAGNIWFIDGHLDTTTPTSCATMKAANSYSTPWGFTNASNIDTGVTALVTFGGTSGYSVANGLSTTGGSGTGLEVNITSATGGVINIGTIPSPGILIGTAPLGYQVGDTFTILQTGSSNDATAQITGYNNNSYTSSQKRTPYTYYNCAVAGDTFVFLNGASFVYADGSGLEASFSLNKNLGTSGNGLTFMARPGASVQLGSTTQNNTEFGIRVYNESYATFSGLGLTGSGTSGGGISSQSSTHSRIIGNTISCPTCFGSTGAVEFGNNDVLEGNNFNAIATGYSVSSNKEYHAAYGGGSGSLGSTFCYNKIANTKAYNGIQFHAGVIIDNFSVCYNDIADVYGAGINIDSIDPSLGPISIYGNAVHHVGLGLAEDGVPGEGYHDCLSFPQNDTGETISGPGTVNVYNNTFSDCSEYLGTYASTSQTTSGAVGLGLEYDPNHYITVNMVNNIIAQPTYTVSGTPGAGTAAQNVYFSNTTSGLTSTTALSGSDNICYSASTPLSATGCSAITTIAVPTNPLMVSAPSTTDGPWTNLNLQSSSPAIGNGSASLYPTYDFAVYPFSNPPAIGALMYQSGSSYNVYTSFSGSGTVSCTPANPVTAGATVSCTMAAGTGWGTPTYSGTCGLTGSTLTQTFTMPSNNCTVVATNTVNSYTLTVTSPTHGTITGLGCVSGPVAYGTSITCQANPATGYSFSGWSGGTLSGTTNPQTFLMGAGAATVTAGFSLPVQSVQVYGAHVYGANLQ